MSDGRNAVTRADGDTLAEMERLAHLAATVPPETGVDDPTDASHSAGGTNRYVKISPLGEGGMGVVWKAEQKGTRRIVALKTISASFIGSERIRRRFEREVELAANLEHPFIARIYDSGLDEGLCFCAMELIDGVSLTKYADDHSLSLRSRVELMHRVCQGVRYAHEHAVIHRDLKPSNIMVCEDGTPKLLDFGLAKLIGDGAMEGGLTMAGDVMGTPAYMPPEQARGESASADTRGDVWSLGAILFELLTGELPFDTKDTYAKVMRRVAEEEPRRPRAVKPSLDREIEAVLVKSLSRDPDKRYASAGDLAEDLKRYLDGEPLAARPATTVYFLRKRIVRYKFRFALIAAAIVAVAAGAVFYVVSIREERARTLIAKLESDTNAHRAADRAEQAVQQRKAALETIREFTLTAQRDLSQNQADARVRESLRKIARAGLEKIAVASDETLTVDIEMAADTLMMGDIAKSTGDLAQAKALYQQAIEQYQRVSKQPRSSIISFRREPAVARIRLARAMLDLGDPESAMRESVAAEHVIESLFKSDPNNVSVLRDRWVLLILRGDILAAGSKAKEALAVHEKALGMAGSAPFGPDDQAVAQRRIAATAEQMISESPATREYALLQSGKAIALDRDRLTQDPKSAEVQRELASSLLRSARVAALVGDSGRAFRDAEEAYATFSREADSRPRDLSLALDAAQAMVLILRGSPDRSESLLQSARQRLQALEGWAQPAHPAQAAHFNGTRAALAKILGD